MVTTDRRAPPDPFDESTAVDATPAYYGDDNEASFFESVFEGDAVSVKQGMLTVNVNATTGPRKSTPLICAARYNRSEVVDVLLTANGINVNETDEEGMTALMMACAYGHEECAHSLIQARARRKTKTKSGWTALMFASERGNVAISAMLIRGIKKRTPEEIAAAAAAKAEAKQAAEEAAAKAAPVEEEVPEPTPQEEVREAAKAAMAEAVEAAVEVDASAAAVTEEKPAEEAKPAEEEGDAAPAAEGESAAEPDVAKAEEEKPAEDAPAAEEEEKEEKDAKPADGETAPEAESEAKADDEAKPDDEAKADGPAAADGEGDAAPAAEE